MNVKLEQLPTQSALGMKWNIEDDKFVWAISDKLMSAKSKKPVTKRSIVPVVDSLVDPLGFIAPYIMKGKLILQMLSRKKIGWDEPLEENENVQWTRWFDDLGKLKEVTVERKTQRIYAGSRNPASLVFRCVATRLFSCCVLSCEK